MSSFSTLTVTGKNKEAAALANGTPLVVSEMAFGDADYAPTGGETALQNELGRKSIVAQGALAGSPGTAFFDILLDENEGPFTIRELGLFDDDGDMIGIAKIDPEINKPHPSSGQSRSITLKLIIAFSDLENLVLRIEANNAYVSAEHRVDTEDGIDGGGDSAQNRTHKLAFGSLSSISGANVDNGTDKFAIYDHSASKHKNLSPEEVAVAIGVQDKIDAAIGGLPEDQVLGLSNIQETIDGTNITKATHAAGVKAAIDGALDNFDPNGSFVFDPDNAGLSAVQISNAQYAASGNRFAFLVGSGAGAFIIRNHYAGCDVMQVQGSAIVTTLNSGCTVLEVMDDGTILTLQGGNYHLSHIDESRTINHIMSTAQGNLPGTLVAGKGNRLYSIASDASSNWAVAHHTCQSLLEHVNPVFLPTNVEDKFNGKNVSNFAMAGAYILPETGTLCLMLQRTWPSPSAHLYIFPDEDTANAPLEFDLTADGAHSLLGIRGNTFYIGFGGTIGRDVAAYTFDGTNLTKQWERGLGLNALNRGQYLIAGETLLGFSTTETTISVLQLEGEGASQRLDNYDIQVMPQSENPYPPNIVSDGDTVFIVPSGWSGGNKSRVSAWSNLAKGAIQR